THSNTHRAPTPHPPTTPRVTRTPHWKKARATREIESMLRSAETAPTRSSTAATDTPSPTRPPRSEIENRDPHDRQDEHDRYGGLGTTGRVSESMMERKRKFVRVGQTVRPRRRPKATSSFGRITAISET